MLNSFEGLIGKELTPLEKEKKKIEERRIEMVKNKLDHQKK